MDSALIFIIILSVCSLILGVLANTNDIHGLYDSSEECSQEAKNLVSNESIITELSPSSSNLDDAFEENEKLDKCICNEEISHDNISNAEAILWEKEPRDISPRSMNIPMLTIADIDEKIVIESIDITESNISNTYSKLDSCRLDRRTENRYMK